MPELRNVLASGDINLINIGTLKFHSLAPQDQEKILEVIDGFGTVGVTRPSVTTFFGYAEEAIAEGDVVYVDGNQVRLASNTDTVNMNKVVGMAVTSALFGEQVEIATDGVLATSAYNLMEGPVFLGVAGKLTQIPPIPPTALFILKLGTSISAGQLSIDIDRAVLLIEEI